MMRTVFSLPDAIEALDAAQARLDAYEPLPREAVADPELEFLLLELAHAERMVARLLNPEPQRAFATAVEPMASVKGLDWGRSRRDAA